MDVDRDHETRVTKLRFVHEIEALMEELDVSQVELARRLNVSEARVSQVLDGSQNLTLATISAIGTALGVRWWPQPVEIPGCSHDDMPAWVLRPQAVARMQCAAPPSELVQQDRQEWKLLLHDLASQASFSDSVIRTPTKCAMLVYDDETYGESLEARVRPEFA